MAEQSPVNDPNKAVNSNVTQHYKPNEKGEMVPYALSHSAGVKSLRLDVVTQLVAGIYAGGAKNVGDMDITAVLKTADKLIERCSDG